MIKNKNISKIVILVTSVRGGSKLFHYSLDNHPQLISFPRTFQFKPFWKSIDPKEQNAATIADKFVENYPRFFDGGIWSKFTPFHDKANRLSENFDEKFNVSRENFKQYLIKLYEKKKIITSNNLFINIHIAFQKAQGKKVIKNSKIVYHIHGLNFIDDIKLCVNDYGINNIKLIFATRHPIQGLNSVDKWMKDLLFPVFIQPQTFFQYQKVAFYELFNINSNFPTLEKVTVLLEHQINSPNKLMEKLCKYLDIQWNDSLLTPTIMGKLWWGNAKRAKKGINKGTFQIFEPKGFLERKDWGMLSFLFPKRYKNYGYIIKPMKLSIIGYLFLLMLPTKVELKILLEGYKNIFKKKQILNQYLVKKKLGDIRPIFISINQILLFFYWFKQYLKRIILSLIVLVNRKNLDSNNAKLLIDF